MNGEVQLARDWDAVGIWVCVVSTNARLFGAWKWLKRPYLVREWAVLLVYKRVDAPGSSLVWFGPLCDCARTCMTTPTVACLLDGPMDYASEHSRGQNTRIHKGCEWDFAIV
jgi:hypothetical protein